MSEAPVPHVPDLRKFENLEDTELQFYGLIGALISLVAGLEHRSLRAFAVAKSLNEKTAAAQFYSKRDLPSMRRQRADQAMRTRLTGEALTAWDQLFERWRRATGDSAPRHLVSHNQVQTKEKHVGGLFDPAIFDPALFDTGRVELGLLIKQDDFQVMANIRRAAQAEIGDLLDNCQEVANLLNDLDSFFANCHRSGWLPGG